MLRLKLPSFTLDTTLRFILHLDIVLCNEDNGQTTLYDMYGDSRAGSGFSGLKICFDERLTSLKGSGLGETKKCFVICMGRAFTQS